MRTLKSFSLKLLNFSQGMYFIKIWFILSNNLFIFKSIVCKKNNFLNKKLDKFQISYRFQNRAYHQENISKGIHNGSYKYYILAGVTLGTVYSVN